MTNAYATAPYRDDPSISRRWFSTVVAATALAFGSAAPLSAQTSNVLNFVQHTNLDAAHYSVVNTTIALTFRDRYGDLQGPPAGTRDGPQGPNVSGQDGSSEFYLFTTKDIHFIGYNRSAVASAWFPSTIPYQSIFLTGTSEISYTPVKIGFPPSTNGPSTLYNQPVMLTGTRNSLVSYDLYNRVTTSSSTLSTAPPATPFSQGNALLATSEHTSIITTGAGIVATVDTGNTSALVTPLISAQGSGPGELNNPSALAIGPDRLLYVLDAGNNRIQKFTVATGAYQGGFSLPAGMTVFSTPVTSDANGNLVYHGTGTDVLSTSMAISPEGHIFLGDGLGGGFVFSLNGVLLANFHPPAQDGTWADGGLLSVPPGSAPGVGSYLQYDGQGNVFTYVEGKGLFRYRDPSYDQLDFVNLTIQGGADVTSGPTNSVLGSLTFRNDLSGKMGKLTIVDPVTVRTGNIYVNHDEQGGQDSTGIIEGGTLVTAGDIHKINSGTLILNNINTYTGKTIVDDGKLIVSGSIAGDAEVTAATTLQIGNGGTTGSIAGGILNNGSLVFNRSNAITFPGVISGTGSLTQSGFGILTLVGANTYSGATNVNAGTLAVNGSLTASAVTVNSGATLGGSGSIGGLTTISSGGIIAPGNSPGTLTFTQGLTLNTGSILNFELGTTSDLIRVTGGTLTGPGTVGGVTLNLSDSGGFAPGTYILINYTTATGTSQFGADSFALGTTIPGYTYNLALSGNTLQLTASAIPEPSTYAAILGAAALGLAVYRKRRQLQRDR
jgi:autotransporter-associated beta strand protein